MIIVGAGLSGLLTAWRCLDVNPDLAITIIDAADRIGGDHTWSFNLTDVPEYLQDWITPFIAYQWPRYEVRFPGRKRTPVKSEAVTYRRRGLRSRGKPGETCGFGQIPLYTVREGQGRLIRCETGRVSHVKPWVSHCNYLVSRFC